MSALDATQLIDSRFKAIEKRQEDDHDDIEALNKKMAVMEAAVADLIDTFRTVRTALYGASGSVLTAALLVVFFGHP